MKTIKTILVCVLLSIVSSAFAENTFKISFADVNVKNGSGDLVVSLEKNFNIAGWQMFLYLPEGVEIMYDEDYEEYDVTLSSTFHKEKHSCEVKKASDGSYLLVCTAGTQTVALKEAESGELCTIGLKVADGVTSQAVAVKKIRVSDASAVSYSQADTTFQLIIGEPYAVLTTDTTTVLSSDSTGVTYGKTLTFYYDNQKDARGGMDVRPFSESDLPAWDAQRASITTTIFDSSFANCTSITSTAYWFFGCVNMTSVVDIGNLKTDNVTDMHSMFWGCSGLTNLDLSKFKTDNVTNMYGMFYGCYSLTTLDLSKFNTTNVTNMSDMFCYCSGLTSLDLSGFNTANVMHTGSMFKFCSELNTIYAGSGWSNEAVTGGGDMFEDCTSLVGGKGTTFDAEHTDATYAHIDGGPSNPGYLTLKLAMGDANGDGYVNIADAVATVTNILGVPTAEDFYQYAADMNNDQVIDIFDVTLIVNAAFDAASPAPAMTRGSADNIMMVHISMMTDANDIYLGIDQPERFTAMQFDVTLPEGMELAHVRLASATTDHQVSFVKLGENEYRVIGLSLSNATFHSLDGQLLKLQTSGSAVDSGVKMSNVLFVTPSNKTVTGIEAVNSSMSNVQRLTWYNLKGQRVSKQQLGKGIYIMNHKKVVMDNYRQAY